MRDFKRLKTGIVESNIAYFGALLYAFRRTYPPHWECRPVFDRLNETKPPVLITKNEII
jgi:hypothetical protein